MTQNLNKIVIKTLQKISTLSEIPVEQLTAIWEHYATKYAEPVEKKTKKASDETSVASTGSGGSNKPKNFDPENGCKFILIKGRPGECCGAKVKADERCGRHLTAEKTPPKPKKVPSNPKPKNNVMEFRPHPVLKKYVCNLPTGYIMKRGDTTSTVLGKILNNKFEQLTDYDCDFLEKKNVKFIRDYVEDEE